MLVGLVQLRRDRSSSVLAGRDDGRLLVMNIEHWWPKLTPSTRAWLIQNNGDVVPPDIVAETSSVGGCGNPEEWWVGQIGPAGFFISDDAIDWIEELANDEDPTNP